MNIALYRTLHFIGIKGSGMAALAILLTQKGYKVTGSDVSDMFYTDQLLQNAGISYSSDGFSPTNIDPNTDAVLYSAAYTKDNNTELKFALEQYPCFSFPEALGAVSSHQHSWAVIGTHGKTTTTAIAGTLCKSQHYPITALTGGRVPTFGNSAILSDGDAEFIAEVCEYKNHFMHFCPSAVLFMSVDLDHTDYFPNINAIHNTFASFITKLPTHGIVVACKDDHGVITTIKKVLLTRQDLRIIWYGERPLPADMIAHNRMEHVTIVSHNARKGMQEFTVQGLDTHADTLKWTLRVPGKALVWNTVGALVLLREVSHTLPQNAHHAAMPINWEHAHTCLMDFSGVSRRCEIVYAKNGYLVLDDYAHHPKAIAMTLEGIRTFYQPKNMIVDFMSHTYSRTESLWEEFSTCFFEADMLIINDIYSSARETTREKETLHDNNLAVRNGKQLADSITRHHNNVHYIADFSDVALWVHRHMNVGDMFVTMGAGDNFRISHMLIQKLDANSTCTPLTLYTQP